MLEHTKTHPTDTVSIIIRDKRPRIFSVPKPKAQGVAALLSEYEKDHVHSVRIPADTVFKELQDRYGKSGAILRGFRGRENLTQVRLAKKLGVRQTDISQIENGKRAVGKKMARRFAKVFRTDYRVFL